VILLQQQQQQPFYRPLSGWASTRRTFTHSHLCWSTTILVSFIHLLRSTASSLFNLCADSPFAQPLYKPLPL